MKSVLITGADRGVGYCLTEVFLREGWKVYAGQFLTSWPWLDELKSKHRDTLTVLPLDVGSDESVCSAAEKVEKLDMLISNAGIPGGEDEAGLRSVYNVNTLAAIRLVEALLPKMETGMKRLAFVSSEAGVITIAHRDGGLGYTLSKAMLNMTVDCMFRELRPKGYTFRLYHPGLGEFLHERREEHPWPRGARGNGGGCVPPVHPGSRLGRYADHDGRVRPYLALVRRRSRWKKTF